jgi:hypothetical protein
MICLVYAAGAVVLFRHFHHAHLTTILSVSFLYLAALMIVIAILLDHPRPPRQARVHEAADKLERRHLLLSTSFCADRAFRVEDFKGEGPHYFLELEEGGILHLSGKYLYHYEPGDGQLRHFPCTRFTVRRHAQLGHVVDILCGGLIIEPEIEAPPYTARDFANRAIPRDGEILRNISFDQLRQERVAPKYRIQ